MDRTTLPGPLSLVSNSLLPNSLLGQRRYHIDIGLINDCCTGIDMQTRKSKFLGQVNLNDWQISLEEGLLVEDGVDESLFNAFGS